MITILSGIAVARTIGTVTFPYLLSNGRSSTLLTLAVLRAVALVALILTLGRLGPLWACAAATLAAVTAHLASIVAVSRSERIGVGSLLGALTPALLASTLMVLAVVGTRSVLREGSTSWVQLGAEIGVGAITYLVAARMLAPRQVDDVAGIIRAVVARERAPGDVA